MRVRDRLVDSPASLGAAIRARRWELLRGVFPAVDKMHVLDLGGTTEFWERAPVRPAHVTVVNLLEPGPGASWITAIEGDACDPVFSSGDYDLAVSNSLLEHVGGYAQRARLAAVIRAAAPRYWVQTPYRYFPIEPHWLFPGMQFAPLAARAFVARTWPLAHTKASSMDEALTQVLWTDLLSKTEMSSLFPDGQVIFEWVTGLPKSLIAVQRG
jgi:hypothetical protein